MKAQRQLLREQIARSAELAKTLGMDAEETRSTVSDEIWEQNKP